VNPTELCPLCSAWVENGEAHRACALQDVLGPIGHLLDHRYWCVVMGEPYAGLTRRESALCVLALVNVYGAEKVTADGPLDVRLHIVCSWAGITPPVRSSLR
jgi:hypothetical protein